MLEIMSTEGFPDPHDDAARALFALARLFNRLPRRDVGIGGDESRDEVALTVVAQAIAALRAGPEPVTIGAVAGALVLDPSTASRLVARGVERGYLQRHPAPGDGRVVALALTASGERLIADAARYQRSVFDRATRDWTPADRATFARLFVQFTAAVTDMMADRTDPTPSEDTP